MLDLTMLGSILKDKYTPMGPWAGVAQDVEVDLIPTWKKIQARDSFVFIDLPKVKKKTSRRRALRQRLSDNRRVTVNYGLEHDRDGYRISLGFELYNGDMLGKPLGYARSHLYSLVHPKTAAFPGSKKEPKGEEGFLEITRYDNRKRLNETSVRFYSSSDASMALFEAFDWWRQRWEQEPS